VQDEPGDLKRVAWTFSKMEELLSPVYILTVFLTYSIYILSRFYIEFSIESNAQDNEILSTSPKIPNPGSLALYTCKECPEWKDITVVGSIPEFLNGNFFHVGPGKFELVIKNGQEIQFTNYLDGIAILHQFQINLGKLRYRSKFQSKDFEQTIIDNNSADRVFTMDQTIPKKTWLGRIPLVAKLVWDLQKNLSPAMNINVNVVSNFPVGPSNLVLKTDVNSLCAIDAETLETLKLFQYADINPALAGPGAAAHPQYDAGNYLFYVVESNEYINFVCNVGLTGWIYKFFSLSDANPKGTVLGHISTCKYHFVHSFSITKNYIIMCFYNISSRWVGLTAIISPSILATLQKLCTPTEIHILSRVDCKKVAEYVVEPFLALHHINAWETNDSIAFDVCSEIEGADVLSALGLENMRDLKKIEKTVIRRITCHGIEKAKKSYACGGDPIEAETEIVYDDLPFEFPAINPNMHMKENRFVFGCCGNALENLVKIDLFERRASTWGLDGNNASEPIFVPNPKLGSEEDGVLISIISNSKTVSSYLLVLDAKTFTEIARADLGFVITRGLHGSFQPLAVKSLNPSK
jgi:carotenoid cleavage dioxygenase-like enzyme